jgi:hypothetical protein
LISGKAITIYDLPKMSKQAYEATFNSKNIMSSFKSTGIFPFNRLVYGDEDFVASYVTDLPSPQAAVAEIETFDMKSIEIPEPLKNQER